MIIYEDSTMLQKRRYITLSNTNVGKLGITKV